MTWERVKRRRGPVAWVATWMQHPSEEPLDENHPSRVAIVLGGRIGYWRARDAAVQRYVDEHYAPDDRIDWARAPRRSEPNLLPTLVKGVPLRDKVYVGDGPRSLYLRKVEDLHVVQHDDGEERLAWTERPKPTVDWLPDPDAR